ncbi:RagB/SusD family nutrient uptake outer membrane protein [Prevotella sp. PJ1A]|uniref:RagB/SusD family nutrient uptake outer membrane protein n=1 Tax=Xylanibacter rodentium TaxID=2736289 RepID=UPI001557BC00|nr:RagB/SusD family nutrient uptake outer membrane protein [Xylanibacter rodentium]NPE10770.1 RagB/SusD family nutrient uptake outer membrane protein [Prevotella sp. PJ1A]
MKNIYKSIFPMLCLAASVSLSSCIDETVPEDDYATTDQVGASSSALEASLNGIPTQMTEGYLVYKGEQVDETDMGYPQFMIALTEMLGDMYPGGEPGYDHYRAYNTLEGTVLSETSYFSYLPWFTLYQFVKTANDVIGAVDLESATDQQKGLLGSAYAARAFDYYMLMTLFEPVENKYTDCSKVLGLTVPIVTEETTGEIAKNNPRVSHEEMVKFILSDLDKAIGCLSVTDAKSRRLPGLAAAYAIRAKVHLWDKDYENAAKYARMAIDASGATPMSETEWTDPTTGFAKACPSWLWYINYSGESMRNLANFVGWMSPEAAWGYGELTMPCIDKSLYDKIGSKDFRKNVFINPGKFAYYDYKTSHDRDFVENAPDYMAVKFRCLNGNNSTYSIGGATDVPVLRVEEMYLIEAEAVGASKSVAEGVALLNDFMKSYRDPAYNYTGTDLRNFQIEVLTQMRIEFWGEGNAFASAKRLKPNVIQNYDGTNAPADPYKINCEGIKPNWTLCIPISEVNANRALNGYNNPNPSFAVEGPTPIGQFASGK